MANNNPVRKSVAYIISVVFIFCLVVVLRFIPIDSYGYSTSGCVGLGTSVNQLRAYRLIKLERKKFYSDEALVPRYSIEMLKALCDQNTATHYLYIL